MPSGGAGGVPRDDLTRHVRDYRERTGQSVRELARRARDPVTDIGVSHGWLNDIDTGAMERAPDLRRLRALAAAMGEPVETLARLAAAQWLGVDVVEVPVGSEQGRDEWVAVAVPPGLNERERERFKRMVADIARHMET